MKILTSIHGFKDGKEIVIPFIKINEIGRVSDWLTDRFHATQIRTEKEIVSLS